MRYFLTIVALWIGLNLIQPAQPVFAGGGVPAGCVTNENKVERTGPDMQAHFGRGGNLREIQVWKPGYNGDQIVWSILEPHEDYTFVGAGGYYWEFKWECADAVRAQHNTHNPRVSTQQLRDAGFFTESGQPSPAPAPSTPAPSNPPANQPSGCHSEVVKPLLATAKVHEMEGASHLRVNYWRRTGGDVREFSTSLPASIAGRWINDGGFSGSIFYMVGCSDQDAEFDAMTYIADREAQGYPAGGFVKWDASPFRAA